MSTVVAELSQFVIGGIDEKLGICAAFAALLVVVLLPAACHCSRAEMEKEFCM